MRRFLTRTVNFSSVELPLSLPFTLQYTIRDTLDFSLETEEAHKQLCLT